MYSVSRSMLLYTETIDKSALQKWRQHVTWKWHQRVVPGPSNGHMAMSMCMPVQRFPFSPTQVMAMEWQSSLAYIFTALSYWWDIYTATCVTYAKHNCSTCLRMCSTYIHNLHHSNVSSKTMHNFPRLYTSSIPVHYSSLMIMLSLCLDIIWLLEEDKINVLITW